MNALALPIVVAEVFGPPSEAVARRRALLGVPRAVGLAFGVCVADMRGPSRARRVARPRQVAMGMIYETAVLSLPHVGRFFGGRDHTTALHAVRRYRLWREALGLDPAFEDAFERASRMAASFGLPPVTAVSPAALFEDPAMSPPTFHPLASSSPHPLVDDPDTGRRFVSLNWPVSAAPVSPPVALLLFGPCEIDPAAFRALAPAMQAEALRLAGEDAASEPAERAAAMAAGAALGLGAGEVQRLLDGAFRWPDMPDETEWQRGKPGKAGASDGETCGVGETGGDGASGDPARADRRAPIEDGLSLFVARHIVPDGRGETDVAAAFATYRRFCRKGLLDTLPRSNFGAALLTLAKKHGGVRAGETITGLALVDGEAAPPAEALRLPPPARPMPTAERCTLLPRALAAVCPAQAAPAPSADPLADFLETRLLERPGTVLSLERLREAVDEVGLSLHDVLARAKARGQCVRRNPWGPDLLADAALSENESRQEVSR